MSSDIVFERFMQRALEQGKSNVQETGGLLPVIMTVGVSGKVGVAMIDPQCDIADDEFAVDVHRLIEIEDACMYLFMTQVDLRGGHGGDERSAAIVLQAYHRDGQQRFLLAPFFHGSEGIIFLAHTTGELAPDMTTGAFKNPFAVDGAIGDATTAKRDPQAGLAR